MHVSINTISSHLSSSATLLLHLLTTPPSPLTHTHSPFDLSIMADRNTTHPRPTRPNNQTFNANSFLRKLQNHVPNSAQLVGFLTLLISGSILLFLTGLAVTVTVLGLIVFAPLLIVSSPIWVPIVTILFLSVAGFLSFCGFGVAVVAGLSWMYRYFRGLHPPGSDQFDYARSRIYDTASHVKDYAREYGGYLQSKVKDAAPGA